MKTRIIKDYYGDYIPQVKIWFRWWSIKTGYVVVRTLKFKTFEDAQQCIQDYKHQNDFEVVG